jgi:predicted nucleic acid-binding protein
VIRALLDANVLVSGITGLLITESTPGALLRRWRDGEYTLVISQPLLSEVERTLGKPFYRERTEATQVEAVLRVLRTEAPFASMAVAVVGIASHPEDDLVLAAAKSAGVDFLVSGDRQLQKLSDFDGIPIISPRQFLAILDEAP